MAIFCQECGTKSDGVSRFCTTCGAPLEPVATQVPAAPPAPAARRSGSNRWSPWLPVVVAALVGLASFLFVQSRAAQPQPVTTLIAPTPLAQPPLDGTGGQADKGPGDSGRSQPDPDNQANPDTQFADDCAGLFRAGPTVGDYIVIWEGQGVLYQSDYTKGEACQLARDRYGDRPSLAMLNSLNYGNRNIDRSGKAIWTPWSGPYSSWAEARDVARSYSGDGNVPRWIIHCDKPAHEVCTP